jgi:molecular chaperone GrpE
MSKAKGPKVEVPEELAAELEEAGTGAPEEQRSGAGPDGDAEAATGPRDEGAAAAPAEGEEPEQTPPEEPPLEVQLEDTKDRYLRLAAEFENYKRRTLKERHDLYNYATENLIKELLPTVDNLERALEHARQTEEGGDVDKFLEGVELTYRSLMQVLEKSGVQVVEGQDAPFDPQVQEAIRQIPREGCVPGTVVEIYQRGYLLKDRLLRPALVAVSSRHEADSE